MNVVDFISVYKRHLTFSVCLLSVKQGKRKRSRPSTASNTPVKDGGSDVSGPAKNSEETKETSADEETSSLPPAMPDTCEPKPAEEQNMSDNSSSTAVAAPTVKEKPITKTSKDRSDRKRERRKERKASESGSPAMPASERASPVCNGTAADDMNVCK